MRTSSSETKGTGKVKQFEMTFCKFQLLFSVFRHRRAPTWLQCWPTKPRGASVITQQGQTGWWVGRTQGLSLRLLTYLPQLECILQISYIDTWMSKFLCMHEDWWINVMEEVLFLQKQAFSDLRVLSSPMMSSAVTHCSKTFHTRYQAKARCHTLGLLSFQNNKLNNPLFLWNAQYSVFYYSNGK